MAMAIEQTTLSCGMPLIVEHIPGVKSASLSWWVPAGTATDPPDRLGRAPMLAELLLRGTTTHTSRELADELDRLGILRAAHAGTQYVRLAATFVGERIAECLPPLAEIILRPRLDEQGIDSARLLCLQALAGLPDNPQQRAAEILHQRHDPAPLNRSSLGNEQGLQALTRQDLLTGWKAQARPGACILAIAGDVTLAPTAQLLESLLKDWTGSPPPLAIGQPEHRGTYFHEHEETHQVQIYLAHQAPPEPSPDARLERVLTSVLSGGSSARLFAEVREKRALCYSVYASYASDKHFGTLTGYVGTTPDKAQLALDVMLEQLAHLAGPTAKVTPDELDRARIGHKSRLVASGESTAARASALASDWHRLGRARSLGELADEAASITLGQLNDYAHRRALGPITIVTLGPGALKAPQ